MKKFLGIAILVIAILALGIYLSGRNASKSRSPNDLGSVPSGYELRANLKKADLEALPVENVTYHIHQHLDLVINGKNITIPEGLGIWSAFISPLHTHDTSGIIHVEAPAKKDFKLGQFFDEWGVRFDDTCMGDYCADDTHKLIVAVNGLPIANARGYILQQYDEIEVWFGNKSESPVFIKSYNFPSNT